jgi:Skp family chaperone for outer membrane proteins
LISPSRFLSARRSDLIRPALWLAICLSLIWTALPATPVVAQSTQTISSPILTIDSERVFTESQFGKRTLEEFEALGAELAAENRRIEEELSAEEKDLTAKRAQMAPADFRVLADAFDEKVQGIRQEQDGKNRELNKSLEERRIVFLNAAAPVLEQLMRDTGAAVILERRSVFLSANAIDVTRTAIERLDDVLGSGSAPAEK